MCDHFACQILLHQNSRHYWETILNDTVCSDLRQHPHHHHLCNGARPLWNMARFSSTLHRFGPQFSISFAAMCENIYFSFFLLISTSVDIHTWTKSQSHPSTGDEELWEKITWLIWTCSTQLKARQEPEVARESNNEPGGEDNTCGHTPPCSLLAPSSNLKWDMRHSEKQAAYCQFVIGSIK